MRVAGLALSLILLAASAAGLEIEDRTLIPGEGGETIRILSTADLDVFEPILEAFHGQNPDLTIDYTVVSSAELHREIRAGGVYDVALSSATDLQFQLANDGFAQRYRSDRTDALPDWAEWREMIFAFTAEPAVVVVSTDRFEGLPMPATRQELTAILRDNPERFRGAVGTYDVRESGLGYLFATQEARATDAYWRLSEVMGRLEPELYCCSGQMIDDVVEGRLALAYNVLGSYATDRLARASGGRVRILRMTDFSNVILRTAIIPVTAENPDAAGKLVDALIDLALREAPGDWPLPPISTTGDSVAAGFGPVRLGPGLMVYLDALNRRQFLAEWQDAIEQR